MFFVNSDLNKSTNQKSLREVIDDAGSKVAYGVLSLKNFWCMAKHISGSDKVFIPKVQRGLVWKADDKSGFIRNCILGTVDGTREPMPNIFLFYDEQTKEIQLFDGLQRTNAILSEFTSVEDIQPEQDVMIPAALFKGSRKDAEILFRNINDKGVKLNDFEKLASKGGEYEIILSDQTTDFVKKFNSFVESTTKQYKTVGLSVSSLENSTLYELLTYAIYEFSNTVDAANLFQFDINRHEDKVAEWGYQLAYSTTIKGDKVERKYSKASMMKNILENFALIVEYDAEEKSFSINKLYEYISNVKDAIARTEKTLRNIYQRNINSSNDKSLCMSAIKSHALINSTIVAYFIYPEHSRSTMQMWYLKQLISERTKSNTNGIVDELLREIDKTENDLKYSIDNIIKGKLSEPTAKTHSSWLWTLYYLQKDFIQEYDLTKEFDIDHIIPQQKLKTIYSKDDDKDMINHIGNLSIVPRKWNKSKSSKFLSAFLGMDPKTMSKYYSFNEEKDFNKILNRDTMIRESYESGEYELAKGDYKTLVKERLTKLSERLK